MLCMTFQVEELVDQRNVYAGDDQWFCHYCVLWSTCFNPVGEFNPVIL